MQSIHKVVKVVNNQIVINLPPEFADREVEVILTPTRPNTLKDEAIRELEREIDIGMRSPASPRSHKEIFDNLREKYAVS